ncbi:hypothetical protein BH20ACT7_BH20ACT7_03970 [soil metagenome]
MAEEAWHAARLIPTSGIRGAEEQERRATSALLAVMASVREFGRALVAPLGAPGGHIETFIEVPFDVDERRVYPDGLIRVTRGQRSWVALVEVKTADNQLQVSQLEDYLDVARAENFDVLLTISNELVAIPGAHPTEVDKRRLRKVALHHLSWTQVLTEAVMQKVFRGVADPDQAWILGELVRYLEHPRSGAMQPQDMGASWVSVREAVSAGTLRSGDKTASEVAARWDQLIRYACLRLGRQLGIEVQPVLSRKELSQPPVRVQTLVAVLSDGGVLTGGVRIPDAIAPISVDADIRAGKVICSVDIDAPREGRQQTRVNWLVRQLKDSPDDVRVDAFVAHGRGSSTSEMLRDVRIDPSKLTPDAKRELRSFRVARSTPMGSKRGEGRGSFVTSVLDALDIFYGDVVQNLRPWAAKPPKLRLPEPGRVGEPSVPKDLPSTSLSSQDGVEEPGFVT